LFYQTLPPNPALVSFHGQKLPYDLNCLALGGGVTISMKEQTLLSSFFHCDFKVTVTSIFPLMREENSVGKQEEKHRETQINHTRIIVL